VNILHGDRNKGPSSAYFPQSNGLAEAGVARCKSLLEKCMETKEDVQIALQELRNAEMTDAPAPSEVFFKRQLRGLLPQLKKQVNVKKNLETRELRRDRYLKQGPQGVLRPDFEVGDPIWMWNRASKRWDIKANIQKIRSKRRSFWVVCEDGESYLRNRIFLKARQEASPIHDVIADNNVEDNSNSNVSTSNNFEPRRSERQRAPQYSHSSVSLSRK
jgi:hypothetical protein